MRNQQWHTSHSNVYRKIRSMTFSGWFNAFSRKQHTILAFRYIYFSWWIWIISNNLHTNQSELIFDCLPAVACLLFSVYILSRDVTIALSFLPDDYYSLYILRPTFASNLSIFFYAEFHVFSSQLTNISCDMVPDRCLLLNVWLYRRRHIHTHTLIHKWEKNWC